ncbi:hypothetical protein TanjilG_24541 [Lupinus angustifolius]|uniref:POX domain-containing protein n=1 Tax=Lupinus angustifolius TaxID=3871 RepID=A0A394D826_LUPAN|nr:hypothetical protein TanjilG_24541 [Lupinus angustifolius]
MATSTKFCYSDARIHQTNLVNQIQGFVTDPEMFNLTTNMEMIGFSKNYLHQQSFFNKLNQQHQGPPSSSKAMNESSNTFYHQEYNTNKPDFTSGILETSSDNHLILSAHYSVSTTWQENRTSLLVDDSSLRHVLPSEGNNLSQRPSEGLSLSLSSNNIGLQPFELRHQHQQQPDFAFSSSSREGFYSKSSQQQQMMQQGANIYQGHFMLKNSKFLVLAQELLNEFCSLETKQNDVVKQKSHQKNLPSFEEDPKTNNSLTPLEFLELQKRKTKLVSMLEEVNRRYRHYRNQMKVVVSSFEAVAGSDAATVYSALALKAMSRHFRCLKDGILDQVQATRKAMGEKEPASPDITKGETPRLRILDQTLRQQRTFQQMIIMETHPWRPRRDVVSNWFINARVRLWKPMVEEMYLEEAKEQENMAYSEGGTNNHEHISHKFIQNHEDKNQMKARLLPIDSECVSSIINNHDHLQNDPNNCISPNEPCFGSMELDFSSYTHHYDHNVNQVINTSSGGSCSGVSLTLGLQQHDESGISLAFPPAIQSSMFYATDQIDEECQPVHYSLLDGETQSNMPYRNLMGSQLFHDLVG